MIATGSSHASVHHLGKHKCELQPDNVTDASYTKKCVEKFPGFVLFWSENQRLSSTTWTTGDIDAGEEDSYKISQQAFRKSEKGS